MVTPVDATVRNCILEILGAHPGCTTAFIESRIGEPHAVIWQELSAMQEEALVRASLVQTVHKLPVLVWYLIPETIGCCELCGRHDHHLREGICPVCMARCALVVSGVAA